MYRETYSTARGVLGFLVGMGWIVAGVGAILLLVGLSSATGRPYDTGTAATLFALMPGAALIIAGLTQVALAQVGFAVLDQADISRATLTVIQKLAERAGIETNDVSGTAKPATAATARPDTGPTDELGFNEAGERIYRGTAIRRADGRFHVGERSFSTLGQAKRHIDSLTGA